MRRNLRAGCPVGTKGAGFSLLALAALLPAAAQTVDLGTGVPSLPAASLPALPAGVAGGSGLQLPGSARGLRLVTRFGLTETLTDNALLSSTDRRAEAITQPSVGVSVRSSGGRLRGFLDYTLTGVLYARGTSGNTLQNALNASLVAEVLEKRAFVEVAGTISQQAVSALGTQSIDPTLASTNRTEVRTLRVSPYVLGIVPGFATYDARAAVTTTHTTSAVVSSATTSLVSLQATGLRAGWVNWGANAVRQTFSYGAGGSASSARANGLLILTVDPQLRFTLSGGYESSDFTAGAQTESRAIYGLRADWSPGPRTRVLADVQRRVFGNAHTLGLTHRSSRTAWTYNDVKDVTATSQTAGFAAQSTLFNLFDSALTSTYPDRDLRAAIIDNYLASIGQSRTPGFLASSSTVQRLQQLSFTLLGIRDTLTLQATRSDAQRINNIARPGGDFATFGRLVQQGLNVSLSHRLTPQSNFIASYSQLRNEGSDASAFGSQATLLRSTVATLSTVINARTRASVSARHARFSSDVSPYHESAVIANVSLQF